VQSAAFRFPTLAMTLLDLFPPGQALPGRLYGSWWHGRYPQEQSADAPFPIDHPLGACILARRAVVEQVGLLDERFFMYTEDVDFCAAIRARGGRILFTPAVEIVHTRGRSVAAAPAATHVARRRSHLAFYQKHYPALAPLLRLYTRFFAHGR